ncbi:MAG: C25 family cysteine peptidase [Salibacteraceae bacterium]
MKKGLAVVFVFLSAVLAQAQPPSNQWIDYSQRYLKIKVTENGLYRIDFNALSTALATVNQSITTFDPRDLQLFGRGEQLHIHVEGEADGSFDPGDFIEFFGEKNDGWLDAELYDTPQDQANPFFSLISDTAAYFLTWSTDPSVNKLRMNDLSPGVVPITPSTYFIKESLVQWTNEYFDGPKNSFGSSDPEYFGGEGWFRGRFGFNTNPSYLLNTANIDVPEIYSGSGAPNAVLRTVVAGVSNATQFPDHRLLLTYGTSPSTLKDTTYDGYALLPFAFNIPAATLASQSNNGVLPLRFGNAPLANVPSADFQTISHYHIRYPHRMHFENQSEFEFWLPASPITYSDFQASNFSTAAATHLYDLTDHNRIAITQSQDSIKVKVPPGGEKRCYLTTAANITNLSASDLQRVNSGGPGQFRDYGAMSGNGIEFILITHNSLWNAVTGYRSYRNNRFVTLQVDVDDLYDQFAYGIPKHPLSIRYFADFLLQNWATAPEHLFLVGKSISERYCRFNATNDANNLVPTISFPSCDNLFTAGLNGTTFETAIPIGRLSAKSTNEVNLYLDKVMEFEAQQNSNVQTLSNKEWMKNVLHFGGGTTANEQAAFRNNLTDYETLVRDTNFGGVVYSFFKTENTPVQVNVSDSIKNLLREGVSLMTFFGHAGGGSFDISIDDPAVWDNQGKYPMLIANSCLVGDIHFPLGQQLSTSEEYVFTQEAGVIAFLSVIALGYAGPLDNYTNAFYRNLSRDNYGATVGELMQETVIASQIPSNRLNRWTSLEFTLHGDPSLVLNAHEKPDYVISPSRVIFEPENITTALDSFQVKVVVTNIGKGTNVPLTVDLDRQLPDGTEFNYFQTVNGVAYRDTVVFTLPVDQVNGVGQNVFNIRVDIPQHVVEELDDVANNQLTTDVWIFSDELFPIYPYDFAVVPYNNVTLKASTGSPFASERDYLFEIDTTDLFNSVSKQSGVIRSKGGVLEWTPNLDALQGQSNVDRDKFVYFWRVAPFNSNPNDRKWREFSFQYIPNQEGWGQAHFFQFKADDFDLINYNRTSRELSFLPSVSSFSSLVVCNPGTVPSSVNANEFRIDGVLGEWGEYGLCGSTPSIYVAVIDSLELKPWATYWVNPSTGEAFNPEHANYGNANNLYGCRSNRPEQYFRFRVTDPTELDSLVNFLTNRIPDGYYILAYTGRRGNFQQPIWNGRLNAFTALGAQQITSVGDSIPYAFFCRKGYPNSVKEVVGSNPFDQIDLDTTISNTVSRGSITTPTIGPAASWENLHWRITSLDNIPTDSVTLEVIGIQQSGVTDTLALFGASSTDIDLSAFVNAQTYPYLQLHSVIRDDLTQTSAQLLSWHVLHEPKPEAAVNPLSGFTFLSDTVQQGEPVQLALAIDNVSDYDMDSLRVVYYIEDPNGQRQSVTYELQDSLRAGSTLFDTIAFDTRSATGQHTFWMEVNPEDSLWQLEQFHFNNLAFVPFYVNSDNTNPTLDVTFDGIHILDGDIVSPKPFVVVRLDDENPFLALNDTADYQVFLTAPNGTQTRIPFVNGAGVEVIRFLPAQLPNNRATLEFQLDLPEDGEYRLMVRGSDRSGNASGDNDYRISFEVINRSTITQVLNYPNPFSTSTRFVFTLTGSEIPEVFTIQILTVTGKVIREIRREELGPITIGRNVTDFAWDGRDEYGDPLANGVYLYRVVTKINGQSVEGRETEADTFFHRGFGKMYLMR